MASVRSATRKESKFFKINFLLAGLIIISIALVIPVSTYAPIFRAEINYQLAKNQTPVEPAPVDTNFSIIIPKINANTKVIDNVDPYDPKIYQLALTKGVAHAKGTSTPDKAGNTFIFAHSAGNWYQANQYNAVFYLLNKLTKGDKIIIYYQSHKYTYTVNGSKTVSPDQLKYLSSTPGQNQLTLMTCWPPGTTLKRLVVIADLKNDQQ